MYDELVKRLRTHNGWTLNKTLDEAADAIEELVGFVQEAERDRDECRERLDKANDAIEELSKPRWIPLQDQQPVEGQHVICFSDIYDVNEAVVRTGKHGLLFLDPNEEYFTFTHVTHWMEMPAPPKGV